MERTFLKNLPFYLGILYLPFGLVGYSLSDLNNPIQGVVWTLVGTIPGVLLLISSRLIKNQNPWGIWIARIGSLVPTIAFTWILQRIINDNFEHLAAAHSAGPYLLLLIFAPAVLMLVKPASISPSSK